MKPLYPALFKGDEAFSLKWGNRPENQMFFRHLMNTCHEFPSLLLAHSAGTGMPEIAAEIARSLLDAGINVFSPAEAVPISAFSQAIGARQMPIGLYLDYDRNLQQYCLSALTNHGGPVDEQDVMDKNPPRNSRTGVLGTTDFDSLYLASLTGLADQFIEDGPGLCNIRIPFLKLSERLRKAPELKILFESDPAGYDAVISPDGQAVSLCDARGIEVDEEFIRQTVIEYLVRERMTGGTVVGPAGKVKPAGSDGEIIEVDGNLFDMNYHAAFSDLLIGWWPGGIIAHQGSSCFGDGILTTIYFIEALRSRSAK
ncbi:MAG: hypothetical protein AB1403_14425 [Candidatus Riflebacteria bacterium]